MSEQPVPAKGGNVQLDTAALERRVADLERDLAEALDAQVATAAVLKVISQSPAALQPTLEAICESARRLCSAETAAIFLLAEGKYHHSASSAGHFGPMIAFLRANPIAPDQKGSTTARAARLRITVHVPDISIDPEFSEGPMSVGRRRGVLSVPLLSNGHAVGVITLVQSWQTPFVARQIQLVETFADQAVIAIENTRLFDEVRTKTDDLAEALVHQGHTSQILRVIAASPTDINPVLQALAESATSLCEAYDCAVLLSQGDDLLFSAHHGPIPIGLAKWPINRNWTAGRAFVDRTTVHVHDLLGPEGEAFTEGRELAIKMGHRTIVSVPLLREGDSIGVLVVRRREVQPFTGKQIALLRTFADQAVIAIQNVRLFEEVQARTRDVSEALATQQATAEILSVISQSPTDAGPVFKCIVDTAARLTRCDFAFLMLTDGTSWWTEAAATPDGLISVALAEKYPVDAIDNFPSRAILAKTMSHFPDWTAVELPDHQRQVRSAYGISSSLHLPMMRADECIGVLTLTSRQVNPFGPAVIVQAESFRDQAMIAMENARQFNETQEALAQQTATADVLKVISRSAFDLNSVLDSLTRSAVELCTSTYGVISLYDGQMLNFMSETGCTPEFWKLLQDHPVRPERNSVTGRTALLRAIVHVPDVAADAEYDYFKGQFIGNYRACLGVPLLRGGELEGVFTLMRREPGAFTQRQIDLVQTFADQAVIAIQNVRLFEDVQARTRDLSEALRQQTATADVLKVISRSAFDLQSVLTTLVESAARLCGAPQGVLSLRDGAEFRAAAIIGFPPHIAQVLKDTPRRAGRESITPRVIQSGKVEHVDDILQEADFWVPPGSTAANAEVRAMLGVPLLRDGNLVGVFGLSKPEPGRFTERQTDIVQTFADQAVIAIENVRLFEDVQARTRDLTEALRQQTATADVLKVISRSAFDLQSVLTTLVQTARDLCEAEYGIMWMKRGEKLYLEAHYGLRADAVTLLLNSPITPDPASSRPASVVAATGKMAHGRYFKVDLASLSVDDIFMPAGAAVQPVQSADANDILTAIAIPLKRDDRLEGVIVVGRFEDRLFTDSQVNFVQTFADQALIAIENVRLFENEQARTRELAASLDNLRATQDRLLQTEKLASLGQLTAGIAHEIKNPLNFVNNFADLSGELVGELEELVATGGAALAPKTRHGINELTTMLKANLAKVTQHGRRADSIVKNMLLHSRTGGSERRMADLNALVDESLNLAYHGARAEKPGFNITLEKSFDAAVGQVEIFPQEFTRVLLNLMSNGFYAATTRKNGGLEPGYEPRLAVETRNLGDRVEITIRDNGTGIPDEVRAKMFNPFFTTKPAGEGTGLGLSLSFDIIKQHGGTIAVATEPGAFTEFTITLPRGEPQVAKQV